MLFARNLWVLAGLMLVAGMATAPTLITTMNLIERIVPKAQLNEGMTIVLTGIIVGVAAGSAVSGASSTASGPSTATGWPSSRAASPSSWPSAPAPS